MSHYTLPTLPYDYGAWEHAYYLQYENRRANCVGGIWRVIDWATVAQRFARAQSSVLS